jgi:hypothetical protein
MMPRIGLLFMMVFLSACAKQPPPVDDALCQDAPAIKKAIMGHQLNYAPDHVLNPPLSVREPSLLDPIKIRPCDVVALDIQTWGEHPNGRLLRNSFDKFEGEGRLEFVSETRERSFVRSTDDDSYHVAVQTRKFYLITSAKPVTWQIYYSHDSDTVWMAPDLLMSVQLEP